MSEVALIASRASSPALKGSAVLAASGGLVAAFAIPANAAGNSGKDTKDAVVAAPAEGSVATIALSERALDVAASRLGARPAIVAPTATPVAPQTFGVMKFAAKEKPPPPPPPPPPAPAQTSRQSGSSGGARTSSSGTSTSSKSTQTAGPQKAATGGVLGVAASLTGIPYRYGGTTTAGFDCSGFTQYVFRQVGVSLPRTTTQQYNATTRVSNPQPGDLVFFGGSNPYHVGIYAGNGMMYDSPRTGKSTSLRKIFSDSAISYGRV